MGKKGGSKALKRITVPKVIPVRKKKHYTWLAKPKPGKHKRDKAITLLSLLRDVLGFANDAKQAKSIVKRGLVKVDGKIVKEENTGLGLMDVIEITDGQTKKFYQIYMTRKGLFPIEINERSAEIKLKKITGKRMIKGKKIQLSFHDGTTVLADNSYKVNDSVVYNLKSRQIDKLIKFEENALVYITDGKHKGKVMTLIKEIPRYGSQENEALVRDKEGKEYITTRSYLFPVNEQYISHYMNYIDKAEKK
ncbi:MAG: S4 domain-containing protein [Candidatus Anstonellales archaeon]